MAKEGVTSLPVWHTAANVKAAAYEQISTRNMVAFDVVSTQAKLYAKKN